MNPASQSGWTKIASARPRVIDRTTTLVTERAWRVIADDVARNEAPARERHAGETSSTRYCGSCGAGDRSRTPTAQSLPVASASTKSKSSNWNSPDIDGRYATTAPMAAAATTAKAATRCDENTDLCAIRTVRPYGMIVVEALDHEESLPQTSSRYRVPRSMTNDPVVGLTVS